MLKKNVQLSDKTVLVTGAAGFIGANLVMALLKSEIEIRVIGLDNLNDYYDVSLKEFRLQEIQSISGQVSGSFTFIKGDIADRPFVNAIFHKYQPEIVVKQQKI